MEEAHTGRRILAWTGVALLVAVVCMVGPLLLVQGLTVGEAAEVGGVGGASAATAALAALFRAGARQLLRSTMMTAVRATTRTASRRVIRSLVPTLLRLFMPVAAGRMVDGDARSVHWTIRLALGFFGLAASFAVVVALLRPEARAEVTWGLPLAVASLLAAAPLLLHLVVLWVATRLARVAMHVQVPVDGILVQAYFSGAGSFLPILTDVELEGSTRAKALCASIALAGTLTAHFVLSWLGTSLGLPWAEFVAAMMLVYAFIFAFPLHPLDGKYIWDASRLVWLALWGASMAAFLLRLPEVFYGLI